MSEGGCKREKLFPYYASRLLPISKGMPNCRVKSGSQVLKVISLPSLRARARALLHLAAACIFHFFSILLPSSFLLRPSLLRLFQNYDASEYSWLQARNPRMTRLLRLYRRWSRRASRLCRILRETAKAKAKIETISRGHRPCRCECCFRLRCIFEQRVISNDDWRGGVIESFWLFVKFSRANLSLSLSLPSPYPRNEVITVLILIQ